MPFVPVPKDLSKIKTKIVFNLTKRQLICFSSAAAIGIPTYIFTREAIGNEGAVLIMIGIMLPLFFIAMYEKDEQPAEKVLRNFIRARLFLPRQRPYKTENFYSVIDKEGKKIARKSKTTGDTRKTAKSCKITSKKE